MLRRRCGDLNLRSQAIRSCFSHSDNRTNNKEVYLITGGHGFLGSHIARRLYDLRKCRIRTIDISPTPLLFGNLCHEFIRGDLRDPSVCELAVRGVHTVLHFAADMGGMGTIHSDNDFVLYEDNHKMTTNILQASLAAGVKRFFYASSACIYPEALQSDITGDTSLHESDAWTHLPPKPQGLYGLEKFSSEILVQQYASKMDIRIARFHNVFGPGAAWNDGREKVPAAMLRKAWALKLHNPHEQFEIWGDGRQRRSFLYVDDAVDGVLKLISSSYDIPFNIGSDFAISISELAAIALKCAGLNPDSISFSYDTSKPVGVASRNSNNEQVKDLLGWYPTVSLVDGMALTSTWIHDQIVTSSGQVSTDEKEFFLQELFLSKIVHLQSKKIEFAILLPITSRGSEDPSNCLSNLRTFSKSLCQTTWRDTHDRSAVILFDFIVYLAIDEDDEFLMPVGNTCNKAEQVLLEEGIFNVVTIRCNHPRGHVCNLWRDCARKAWTDGRDYMVLMGDDVTLQDEGWMRSAHRQFCEIAETNEVPFGFGCVAFTDTSFYGMPTFPIIHRTHMEIFQGQVIPDVFVNQDGDPFLFQVYRQWDCSRMFSSRISNSIGGEGTARYEKHHAPNWTFDTLDEATSILEGWLRDSSSLVERKITLDVVIPCYRVDLSILANILSLKPSASSTVMFIIIIDNPDSPHIFELQSRYSHRPDVRIRVNKTNLGAPASRNRGMEESAAEWVHFLDDDVIPDKDLLKNAEQVIRNHPTAAGFVGASFFPVADSVFTNAVHLAGLTYFWDIATKIPNDVPWGVTANLIARRNVKDDVKFDLRYPKTGGGEDIHFCRMKRDFSLQHNGEGFIAAPKVIVTHPWWNNGRRSYWRFYNWALGDGGLVKNFPENTYIDFAPNSAELMLLCGVGAVAAITCVKWSLLGVAFEAFISLVLANVLHDCFRHLYKHPERNAIINTCIKRPWSIWWIVAVVESSFIRMFSEMGRLRGTILREEYWLICRRFDWFTGRVGNGPIREERTNSLQRVILAGLIFRLLTASSVT